MADPTMVDITIHYGGAAAALTIALALGAFDYAADAAREKSAAELAKIDRDLAAATPDDDLALGAALHLILSPPLRMAASLACDIGAFLLTLLTRTMEVILGWLWGSPGYFRTGRRLARVRTVRATIPSRAPPRHGKMLMNLLLPGPTAADIMFNYGRATTAILLALTMWYCRQTACFFDDTARACSASAKRRLQSNVALLERGEIFGYYVQALFISIFDGATTLSLRAIFYPLCLVWQIERVIFAWLANPGREHPTEIYGRHIDRAATVASLLLEMGRRHLLKPLIILTTKLGLLLRYLIGSTVHALEKLYGLTEQTLGQLRCSLAQTLLDLQHLFGHLRLAMQQGCLPSQQQTELPAIHTVCQPQHAKHDDMPALIDEDTNTELPSRYSQREHEGLDPHGPSLSWPTTSTLPISKISPCRYLLGRRKQPLGRREQNIHTIYNERLPCTRKYTVPRCEHFLLPSIAKLLLRTRDKALDVTCWSIARLPSYILPEDDVIKWA